MPKNEAQLKGEFCYTLRQLIPRAVVLRHEDIFRAGVPDISFTWNFTTTWIEAKYAAPRLRLGKKLQLVTMQQLEYTSRAWYLIWAEQYGVERTFIVPPVAIHLNLWTFDMKEDGMMCRLRVDGFSHMKVAEFIKGSHSNDYY